MELRELIARGALVACAIAASSCAPKRVIVVPEATLDGSDGRAHALVDSDANLTVVELFSAHCPCQAAHDGRLRDLATAYQRQRVAFVALDSEVGASVARDRAEASKRAYPFPILVDPGGKVARSLGAEYATYALVIDHAGRVVYRGGIDSDRTHLTDDATPWLSDALDDALAGKPMRRAEAKTLGCALAFE